MTLWSKILIPGLAWHEVDDLSGVPVILPLHVPDPRASNLSSMSINPHASIFFHYIHSRSGVFYAISLCLWCLDLHCILGAGCAGKLVAELRAANRALRDGQTSLEQRVSQLQRQVAANDSDDDDDKNEDEEVKVCTSSGFTMACGVLRRKWGSRY